jgi:pyoverdine/dityrosine biosynthesis protein Dit1
MSYQISQKQNFYKTSLKEVKEVKEVNGNTREIETEKKTLEIYSVLMNKRFVRQKPSEDFMQAVLTKIKTAVEDCKPIEVVLGFGYHKNPNACTDLLPDIAEKMAIEQLANWVKTIKDVYQGGMEIKIITSGKRAEIVNGMKPEHTLAYHLALQKMVAECCKDHFVQVFPIGELYDQFHKDFQQALEKGKKEINPDWADPFWIKQAEHARSNIWRYGLSEEEITKKSQQAVADYVIYHKAEMEANLLEKKFPGAIRASYNRHEESLVLWTTANGDITQPWQGKGEIGGNGRITVITQKRKGGEI